MGYVVHRRGDRLTGRLPFRLSRLFAHAQAIGAFEDLHNGRLTSPTRVDADGPVQRPLREIADATVGLNPLRVPAVHRDPALREGVQAINHIAVADYAQHIADRIGRGEEVGWPLGVGAARYALAVRRWITGGNPDPDFGVLADAFVFRADRKVIAKLAEAIEGAGLSAAEARRLWERYDALGSLAEKKAFVDGSKPRRGPAGLGDDAGRVDLGVLVGWAGVRWVQRIGVVVALAVGTVLGTAAPAYAVGGPAALTAGVAALVAVGGLAAGVVLGAGDLSDRLVRWILRSRERSAGNAEPASGTRRDLRSAAEIRGIPLGYALLQIELAGKWVELGRSLMALHALADAVAHLDEVDAWRSGQAPSGHDEIEASVLTARRDVDELLAALRTPAVLRRHGVRMWRELHEIGPVASVRRMSFTTRTPRELLLAAVGTNPGLRVRRSDAGPAVGIRRTWLDRAVPMPPADRPDPAGLVLPVELLAPDGTLTELAAQWLVARHRELRDFERAAWLVELIHRAWAARPITVTPVSSSSSGTSSSGSRPGCGCSMRMARPPLCSSWCCARPGAAGSCSRPSTRPAPTPCGCRPPRSVRSSRSRALTGCSPPGGRPTPIW
jgi:hypothetical protein